MFIPAVHAAALFMMILSVICRGSWANTQKLCKNWRFEIFYRVRGASAIVTLRCCRL